MKIDYNINLQFYNVFWKVSGYTCVCLDIYIYSDMYLNECIHTEIYEYTEDISKPFFWSLVTEGPEWDDSC